MYCYLCFSAIETDAIDSHLATIHFPDVPMDCGLFHHQSETKGEVINPGLCPFCLADKAISPRERFRFFTKRREHILHLSSRLEVHDDYESR